MMGQSNTETLLALSQRAESFITRIDVVHRRILHRDQIMAQLLRGEITAKRAVQLMQEADW